MTDVIRALGLSAAGSGAVVILLVLPGLRLAERLAGRRRSVGLRLVLAVLLSQLIVAAIGIVLVAIGRFSGTAVALIALAWSVTSLPVLVKWMRSRPSRPRGGIALVAWVGCLALPWAALTGAAGWPPGDTLQWYYAGLGAQLTAAGGIPASVAEWGLAVRWLPDYLVFNIDSEAFFGLLPFLSRADALAAWRVPIAILGLVLLALVLRLWLGRPATVAGVVATAGTVFFLAKFDAYKPEAVGIVIGLAALWITVQGVRHGRASWVFLGGASLGVGLSIHVIAATVMGLIVVGIAGAEWLALRRARSARLGWLVRAAMLGLVLSTAMGVGVQGRATVAGSALNPVISSSGADPTWTFFLRSTGDFREPEPLPPARPIAGGVRSPWAGLRLTSAFGWWVLPVIAIGFAAAFGIDGRRRRAGIVGLALAGSLVLMGVLFFALRFNTYVPRWTGLVRFGQYAPLAAGFAVAFAVQGYVRTWSWLVERRIPWIVTPALAVVGAGWLLATAATRYNMEQPIAPAGTTALERLRSVGRPGDVVLSNVLTTGTIEFFTGLEDPLEGRQPLIEEPSILASANRLLGDARQFFATPTKSDLLERLSVRWVLVADDPGTLGASATVGGSVVASTSDSALRPVWSAGGIALFEVISPSGSGAVTDDAHAHVDPARAALAALVALAGAIILVAPGALMKTGRRLVATGRRRIRPRDERADERRPGP